MRISDWSSDVCSSDLLGPSGDVIPGRMIAKPPSAELRPYQKDEDSLPPYATLDAILHGLIEEDLGADALEARGFDAATVQRIWRLLELRSEEHTSELQSLMRISYAVFCLKKTNIT